MISFNNFFFFRMLGSSKRYVFGVLCVGGKKKTGNIA